MYLYDILSKPSDTDVITMFQEDIGDISQRQDLRRDLKCQSFDWYIKNIYPEVFLPSEALQRGTVSQGHHCPSQPVEQNNFRVCRGSVGHIERGIMLSLVTARVS